MTDAKSLGPGTVYVVDDDEQVRDALGEILTMSALRAVLFSSPEAFLAQELDSVPACVVLDLRMPGLDGLEVLRVLKQERASELPVVLLTAHGSVVTAVDSMKLGAFDFVEKSAGGRDILAVVGRALVWHAEHAPRASATAIVRGRVARLSRREREILDLIVAGLSTKTMADRLTISPHTVDNHRAKIMQKMKASSVADLVRMACATSAVAPLAME